VSNKERKKKKRERVTSEALDVSGIDVDVGDFEEQFYIV
jgi:hypothetical protein